MPNHQWCNLCPHNDDAVTLVSDLETHSSQPKSKRNYITYVHRIAIAYTIYNKLHDSYTTISVLGARVSTTCTSRIHRDRERKIIYYETHATRHTITLRYFFSFFFFLFLILATMAIISGHRLSHPFQCALSSLSL